jgi:hypothetical protein
VFLPDSPVDIYENEKVGMELLRHYDVLSGWLGRGSEGGFFAFLSIPQGRHAGVKHCPTPACGI